MDSCAANMQACSTSYTVQALRPPHRAVPRNAPLRRSLTVVVQRLESPAQASGRARSLSTVACQAKKHQRDSSSANEPAAQATEGVEEGANEVLAVAGYTPANYITYSIEPQHVTLHQQSIVVGAPASACFAFWNDWNRLVDFLDLIAQIGLDPNSPDKALIQCFYRFARLPTMEIIFIAQKTNVVEDQLIEFESVWGMPAAGRVVFQPTEDGKSTLVTFSLEHGVPHVLLSSGVGPFGLQGSLGTIFRENLETYRQVVEAYVADPAAAPRAEAGALAHDVYESSLFQREETPEEEEERLQMFVEEQGLVLVDDEEEGEQGERGSEAAAASGEPSQRQAAGASGAGQAGAAAAAAAAGAAAAAAAAAPGAKPGGRGRPAGSAKQPAAQARQQQQEPEEAVSSAVPARGAAGAKAAAGRPAGTAKRSSKAAAAAVSAGEGAASGAVAARGRAGSVAQAQPKAATRRKPATGSQ